MKSSAERSEAALLPLRRYALTPPSHRRRGPGRMRALDWSRHAARRPPDGRPGVAEDHRANDARLALRDVDGCGGPSSPSSATTPTCPPSASSASGPWARSRQGRAEVWTPRCAPRMAQVIEKVRPPGTKVCCCSSNAAVSEETYHTFSYSPVYDDERANRRNAVRGHRSHGAGARRARPRVLRDLGRQHLLSTEVFK